jgi:hypothetical protein
MARMSTWDLPPDEGPSRIYIEPSHYYDKAGNKKLTVKLSWFHWFVPKHDDSSITFLSEGGRA